MADYIIWHIEREPNRRYPLGGGIRTVEDVSDNIFELTNVTSCTIIEWAKKAKIVVLIEAGDEAQMITSIVHSDAEALENILQLHAKGKRIDLDPTYSTGNFYKTPHREIWKPKLKFDIIPQVPGVLKADVRNLPLPDASVEVIVFDPPFLATTGPSLRKKNSSNKINKRFGVYPNESALFDMYSEALQELARVCQPKGILIFKCQDKVSSGKQYFSHCTIYERAKEYGWDPIDLFVLVAKNRLVADWQKKNQKHARKFHCFYWVFQRTLPKLDSIGEL